LHDGLAAAAEESKNLIHETPLRRFAGDGWRKNMEVPDLFQPVHDALGFHAVDGRLNGGVGRPFFRREGLQDVADGALLPGPEGLHDLELEPGKFGLRQAVSYMCSNEYHRCLFWVNTARHKFWLSFRLVLIRRWFLDVIDCDYVDCCLF